MEYLFGSDGINWPLTINGIKPANYKTVAFNGPLFMVRLKIIIEQAYCFFCGRGSPPYSCVVRSLGGGDYKITTWKLEWNLSVRSTG